MLHRGCLLDSGERGWAKPLMLKNSLSIPVLHFYFADMDIYRTLFPMSTSFPKLAVQACWFRDLDWRFASFSIPPNPCKPIQAQRSCGMLIEIIMYVCSSCVELCSRSFWQLCLSFKAHQPQRMSSSWLQGIGLLWFVAANGVTGCHRIFLCTFKVR